MAAALLGLVLWAAPDVAPLATENPQSTAFMRRWSERTGEAVAPLRWTPSAAISTEVKRAVLVAEDIDFFSHSGFAPAEIRRAVDDALAGRRLRGASTITQQLAKNLWLGPSRTPWRKLEEAWLAFRLERQLDKDRILEVYLNVVEFGPGVWGIGNASWHYFGVPPRAVDADQAAALAAGLSRPASWHPGVDSAGYRKRTERIRRRMDRAEWLVGVVETASRR